METFPQTEADRTRFQKYAVYEDIFMGNHTIPFARFSAEMLKKKKVLIYIVCNFGALISKVSADLLFGEPVDFKFKKTDDKKIVDKVQDFVLRNKINTQSYESALSNSYFGDSVAKLRRDADGKAIFEYCSPQLVKVITDPDNVKDTKEIQLCWEKIADGKTYLRKEIHEKGKIRNELWLKEGDILKSQVDLSVLYDDLKDEEVTNIDDFLVKIIPNFKTSTMIFGISDYNDLLSLFDEINNRITRSADIFNRHSDPKLAVPPGVLNEDGKVKTGSFELFEVSASDTKGLVKPEYITWDASLEAAFKHIDKLVEFIFLFSETSPSVFGMDSGGQAESGRALKFRLLRTLAKISRKRNYYDEALNWAIITAQKLEGVAKPILPDIMWNDGIPADTMEMAQIEEIRLRAGNTSKESSIRRLDGGSDEDVESELKKIDEEEAKLTPEIGKNEPNMDIVNNPEDSKMKKKMDPNDPMNKGKMTK